MLVLPLCARHKRSTPICFSEMGLSPNRILDDFRNQSEFSSISPNEIANYFLEEDKAIEVRSEIIRTRLGC